MASATTEAGRKLRAVRERLHLRYRDVEEASQRIAARNGSDEFLIGLSRLADIENKGTVPTIFRLYSLCAIYGLQPGVILNWYGVDLAELAGDIARAPIQETRPVDLEFPAAKPSTGLGTGAAFDPHQTSFITRQVQRWGRVPASFLSALDLKRQRYAFIGTEDWSMHPIIPPGSFVQIDETRRRIARDGWTHELERPIYFIEHHDGYSFGWCSEADGYLIVQPHPLSSACAEVFQLPGEAEVIGQIVGVAMRLDQARARRKRS